MAEEFYGQYMMHMLGDGFRVSGRVHGVGFGRTPFGRNKRNIQQYTMSPPSSNEMEQRLRIWRLS